jgi:hypothetical protein
MITSSPVARSTQSMPPARMDEPPYTTRLQKGGALVREMRLLVQHWNGRPGCPEQLLRANVISAPSRLRAWDAITRTFVPRFVSSRPADLWRSLGILERAGWGAERLLPIHYYAAAAAEPLLWDFVAGDLAERHALGQSAVRTDDVLRFLRQAPESRFVGRRRWTSTVSTRVARGLLAALRDFGVLAGAAKKRFTPLYLPAESFAFLAMIRNLLGYRGRRSLTDPCWQLFFLSDTAVERFFIEAQQRKLLEYHAAGSVVRIEFPAETLDAYAHELAQRAH